VAGVLEEAESGAGCVLDAPAWGAESEEDVVGDGLDDGAAAVGCAGFDVASVASEF